MGHFEKLAAFGKSLRGSNTLYRSQSHDVANHVDQSRDRRLLKAFPTVTPNQGARYFLHEVLQMPVSVRREALKTLKYDRGTDYEAERYPKPPWVGSTEQQAEERVGDNPLIERIKAQCGTKSDWRQSNKNDEAQSEPGQVLPPV